MQLFYCPSATPSSKSVLLDEEESRHAIKVLRYKAGDLLTFTDGKGYWYEGKITSTSGKTCMIEVLGAERKPQPSYYIHVAVAPTKNFDRMAWMMEKCMEFGVDEFTFLQTEHSEREKLRVDRLERLAVSAMKQSLHAKIPMLNGPTIFTDFLREVSDQDKYIAHIIDGAQFNYLSHNVTPDRRYCIAIGPEGGFSVNEITLATQAGFQAVSLGDSRLRTETAAISACHIFNLANLTRG